MLAQEGRSMNFSAGLVPPFEDIAPPYAVGLPRILTLDDLPPSSRLSSLRKLNARKYRKSSTTPHTLGTHYYTHDVDLEVETERLILFTVGLVGLALNFLLLLALLSRRALRNVSYAFVVHGALVDMLKATYAILYGIYIHPADDLLLLPHHDDDEEVPGNPHKYLLVGSKFLSSATRVFGSHYARDEKYNEHWCTFIGTTYFIVLTISIVNLIAILCTETYIFTDDNLFLMHSASAPVGPARAKLEDLSQEPKRVRLQLARKISQKKRYPDSDEEQDTNEHYTGEHRNYSLNYCCVLFAVCIIYVSSLILHLGPTIIASQFDMSSAQDEFYCNFVPGMIRNYISYLMWLGIVTLTMFGACFYASVFYRYVNSNGEQQVNDQVRDSVWATSRTTTNVSCSRAASNAHLRVYKNRAHVMILVLVGYALCYYPQFILMIFSVKLAQPTVVYKVLRIISLSNPIVTPLVFLIIDSQVRPGNCLYVWLSSRCARGKLGEQKRRRNRGDKEARSDVLINMDADQRSDTLQQLLEESGDRLRQARACQVSGKRIANYDASTRDQDYVLANLAARAPPPPPPPALRRDEQPWNEQSLTAPSSTRVRRRVLERPQWSREDASDRNSFSAVSIDETLLNSETTSGNQLFYNSRFQPPTPTGAAHRMAVHCGSVQISVNL